MLKKDALRLYLCTDRGLTLGRPLASAVESAIEGGVTMLQVREKTAESRDFYEFALEARRITKTHHIPLVINDRLDIALAVSADGLHIGQSDLPLSVVRCICGEKLFIGVSAGTVEEALAAEAGGADYLGVGPVFPTGSKADAGDAIGIEDLKKICSAVRIPVVGIGGIGVQTAAEVMKTGSAGIAVISAILSQPDIKAAAERLRRAVDSA
jgi:thiamine-phosphate pyrophosphorylase